VSEDLGAIYWRVEADTSGLRKAETDMDAVGKTAADSGQKVDNFGKDAEAAGKKTATGMSGAATAIKAVGVAMAALGVGKIVNDFAATAVQTAKLQASLKTMTGSTEAASAAWDNLLKFASTTPFTLDQSVQGFIKLKALGLDPSERALQSYGNTAAAMGKDLNQMIEAVADASTMEFERLKEFGIKARQEGDNVAFTFQGVTTEVGKNADEIQQYLMNIGEVQFGTAMADQMEALPGLISNLEDNVSNLYRAIGDQGANEAFEGGVKAASAAVVAITENLATLGSAAEVVAVVFGSKMAAGLAASTVETVKKTAATFAATKAEVAKTAATSTAAAAEVASTAATLVSTKAELAAAQATAARMAGMPGFTIAMNALTAAEARNTAATTAHAAATKTAAIATAAHTTAMAASTTAASVLRGALALLGGPAGIAIVAAYGVYKLVDSFLDSKDSADDATDSMTTFNGVARELNHVTGMADATTEAMRHELSLLANGMNQAVAVYGAGSVEVENMMARMDELNAELRVTQVETAAVTEETVELNAAAQDMIATLQEQAAQLGMSELELEIYNNTVKAGVDPTSELGMEIAALTEKVYRETEAKEASETAQKEATKALEEHIKAAKKMQEEIDKQVQGLQSEYYALQLTSRQQAIWNAELAAFNSGASVDTIRQISEMTARNYDLAESQRSAAAESEAMERAAVKAAEESQRNWERTHEYLTTSFIDIFDNGKDAFGKIEDAFKNMIKRMVAEWAASKLMNLFGIGSGSGNTASNLLGTILGAGSGGGSGGGGSGSVAGSVINQALGGGGGMAGVGGSVIGAAGQFIGGLTGTAVGTGSAIVGPPTAAAAAGSGIGSSIMAGIGAIPGWGWAMAGVAAAAALLAKKETPSANAGMLVGPAPGAPADRTFAVDPFASGFRPTGFARREDQGAAMDVIAAFASVDAKLTEAIRAAGGYIDMSGATLSGFSETGQGAGVFLGLASEKGQGVTSVPLQEQLSRYAADVMRHASGIDETQKAMILGGIDGSHATGLNRVPFNGYIAELHEGERVKTRSEANAEDAQGTLMQSMYQMLMRNSQVMTAIIQRWDFDGLPGTRAVDLTP
jgi:hypothetical protein